MKTKLLSLALLLSLLVSLGGCSRYELYNPVYPQISKLPTALAPPTSLLNILGISSEELAGFEGMYEKVNQSHQQEGSTLTVLETLGDGTTLIVLYSQTIPDSLGEDPSDRDLYNYFSPLYVATDNEYFGYYEDSYGYVSQTRTMYSVVTLSLAPYTDQEVTLQIKKSEDRRTKGYVTNSVTWTAHNQAPTLEQTTDDGTCSITPLRMQIRLKRTVEEASVSNIQDPFEEIKGTMSLTYRNGTVLRDLNGGMSADPILVSDVQPPDGSLFRLDEVESVSLAGVTFSFQRS